MFLIQAANFKKKICLRKCLFRGLVQIYFSSKNLHFSAASTKYTAAVFATFLNSRFIFYFTDDFFHNTQSVSQSYRIANFNNMK